MEELIIRQSESLPRVFVTEQGRTFKELFPKHFNGALEVSDVAPEPRKGYIKEPVHRLVAEAWVLGRSPEKWFVSHVNGDKKDNRADNLEWTAPGESSMRYLASSSPKPEALPANARNEFGLTAKQMQILRLYVNGYQRGEIAAICGIDKKGVKTYLGRIGLALGLDGEKGLQKLVDPDLGILSEDVAGVQNRRKLVEGLRQKGVHYNLKREKEEFDRGRTRRGEELSDRTEEVTMLYLQGYGQDRISQATGMSPARAREHIHKAQRLFFNAGMRLTRGAGTQLLKEFKNKIN